MPVPDGASADSGASQWPAKASISLRAPRSPSACAARRRGQGKASPGSFGMDQILPYNSEDALIVLRMAIEIVERFLAEGEEPAKRSVVQLVRE